MSEIDVTTWRRRAFVLEWTTLMWNVVGVAVLVIVAWRARSVALTGFGLDSLVEIGASLVVLWDLAQRDDRPRDRALRLIGRAFLLIAVYLFVQGSIALATRHHAAHSRVGIAWTAATALVMFSLAAGKTTVGRMLANATVIAEGRVTFVDGVLATSILVGLLANTVLHWWWADPIAGFVVMFYAFREFVHVRREARSK
ncbi:MAG: cation transporter [Acidobacteriota bacterium]|nr:cation transporter [Acidobacteriota bacterium]MDE3107796.1 cation transporter [Acidobacteriota bacterium]